MKRPYVVHAIETVNIPDLHPGITFLNYQGYIGDGQFVDVRTRIYAGGRQEIGLAQIVDDRGKVLFPLTPDDVELAPLPPGTEL